MEKILTVVVLVLLAGTLMAQIPVSVRNQSLGGIVNGEWEDIFDPINLKYYAQKYYFTNLSDLTQQMELYEDDVTLMQESEFLSEYPLGFTFKNPFDKMLKHSFMVRYKDNNIPALYDGYGESETYTTNYVDTNGDSVHDYYTSSTVSEKNYDDIGKRLLLLLNTNVILGDKSVGLRIAYDTQEEEYDQALNPYSAPFDYGAFYGFNTGSASQWRSTERYNLPDGLNTYRVKENGEFSTITSANKLSILFSAMKPTNFLAKDSELRFDFSIDELKNKTDNTTESYYGSIYSYYDAGHYYSGNFWEGYTVVNEAPILELFINARLRHNLDNITPRYKQGFWEVNCGIGQISGTETYGETSTLTYERRHVYSLTDFNTTNRLNSQDSYKRTGKVRGTRSKLSGKGVYNLSNNVCFAYGGTLDWVYKYTNSDIRWSSGSTDYDINGAAFDGADDIRTRTHSLYTGSCKIVENVLESTFPVALEFSMPKESITEHDGFGLRNFSFRLGSIFKHLSRTKDYRYADDVVEVYTAIEENGLGAVISEEHSEETSTFNQKLLSEEKKGKKIYTGGIGYRHSDFLNIDLGGWINSDGEEFYLGAMFTVKK